MNNLQSGQIVNLVKFSLMCFIVCFGFKKNLIGLDNLTEKKPISENSATSMPSFSESTSKFEIPTDGPTSAEFNKSLYAFLKKQVLKPNEKHAKDKESQLYLDNVLKLLSHQADRPILSELLNKGKELVNKNSNDYGIIFAYGYCLYADKNYKEAINVLRKSFNKVKNDKSLSNIFVYLNAGVLSNCLEKEKKRRWTEWCVGIRKIEAAIRKDEFAQNDSRILLFLKDNFIRTPDKILNALKKKKNVDPWLIKVLTGEVEKDKAWKARGKTWASGVSKQGWVGFKDHLAKSRSALKEAWEMHPDRPEPAVLMITVAMGGHAGPGETTILWFNRAVKAEIDYKKAYGKLLWALRPRWGGNYKIMYDLGSCSLNTKRFETKAPEYFLMSLVYIATDLSGYRLRSYFHQEDTRKKLHQMFEGLLGRIQNKNEKERIMATRVLCEVLSGEYENAQKHLKEVNKNFNFRNLLTEYRNKACLKYSREDLENQINAGMSDPEKMNKAYQLFFNGKVDDAVAKFQEVLLKIDQKDSGAKQFVISEIGYMMINYKSENLIEKRHSLSQCVPQGHKKVLDFLLSIGADVNTADINGATPLHLAGQFSNDIGIFQSLIDNGAKINITQKDWTPLHYAARYSKNVDVIKLLIDKGANTKTKTDYKYTPYHLSLFNDSIETFQFFLNTDTNIDTPAYKERSMLNILSNSGKLDKIKMVINKGADINFCDENGNTSLHLAILRNKIGVVKYLLEKEADIMIKNKKGDTPESLIAQKENGKKTKKQGKVLREIFNSFIKK